MYTLAQALEGDTGTRALTRLPSSFWLLMSTCGFQKDPIWHQRPGADVTPRFRLGIAAQLTDVGLAASERHKKPLQKKRCKVTVRKVPLMQMEEFLPADSSARRFLHFLSGSRMMYQYSPCAEMCRER